MKPKLPEVNELDIDKILEENEVKLSDNIQFPPAVLSIIQDDKEFNIMHRGGFSIIKGQSKGRKSTLMSIAAAAFNNDNPVLATFKSHIKPDEMVLYMDTEQAKHEAFRFVKIIAGLSDTNTIRNIKMVRLRKFTPDERLEIIKLAVEKYKSKLAVVIIDGFLDLCYQMNSETEATDLTSWLLKTTEDYNIHIAGIIHENWGDGKASGHIGSSAVRRAETIISVNFNKKDKDYSIVQCDMMRGKWFESFMIGINEQGLPFVNVAGIPISKKLDETPF